MERVEKKRPENLPPIADKLYFTIGEVSRLCGVKPHVLRYWEQEFTQIRPSKRRGNRRYYQHKDVLIIRQIRSFLYEDGYTIVGTRQRLAGEKVTHINVNQEAKEAIRHSIVDLEGLLESLNAES